MRKLIAMLLLLSLVGSASALERADWLSPDQYYYQQLSAAHKAAWEHAITNALNYPNQTEYGFDVRHQALGPMIKADNPRIFWIDWIDSNGLLRFETGNTPHYKGLTFPQGKTLADYQQLFQQGVDAAVKAIKAKLPKNADAKAKVKAIYKWLCDNNTYNDNQTSKFKQNCDPVSFAYLAAHSAYSAIIPGDMFEPVCEGYACAFKVLCDELGVPCVSVSGSVSGASQHMWNHVKLGSTWHLVDVTTGDMYSMDAFCIMTANNVKKQKYEPNPYMGSGVRPDNGYTEGAAFTVPELSKK